MPDYRRRATKEAMSLRFDFHGVLTGEMQERVVPTREIQDASAHFEQVHEQIQRRREAGELPFLDWIHVREGLAQVKEVAEAVRREAKTFVLVGTGGTALAAQTLVRAQLTASPRIVFADAIDPDQFGTLLEELDIPTTVFNVVSKSGETAETLAQFLIIRDLLLRQLGAVDYTRHLIVTTDADQGVLRQIVHDEGFRSLAIPPGISDRFGALSPASLLPAAVAGIKVDDVLAGASWMDARCQAKVVWQNPALLLAAWLYLAHTRHGLRHIVFLPFCRLLETLAQWSAELLIERLPRGVGSPSSPGPDWLPLWWRTRDVSLLSEFIVQRRSDTVAVLLSTADHGREIAIAQAYQDLDALAYLGGKGAGQILRESERAFQAMLRRHSCSYVVGQWPQVNAFTLGQWLFALELMVVYLAELFRLDLWAQSAAEGYRRLLSGQLGRKGFEAQREEVERLLARQRDDWIL